MAANTFLKRGKKQRKKRWCCYVSHVWIQTCLVKLKKT